MEPICTNQSLPRFASIRHGFEVSAHLNRFLAGSFDNRLLGDSCYRRESGMAKRNSNKPQEHGRTGWRSNNRKKHLIVSPMCPRQIRKPSVLRGRPATSLDCSWCSNQDRTRAEQTRTLFDLVRVAFACPLNLRTDLSRRLRDGVSLSLSLSLSSLSFVRGGPHVKAVTSSLRAYTLSLFLGAWANPRPQVGSAKERLRNRKSRASPAEPDLAPSNERTALQNGSART